MWVGGVADSQTRSKPFKNPSNHPENRLFRPKFHLSFSQISQKAWDGWVGKQIWERYPKKNVVFFGSVPEAKHFRWDYLINVLPPSFHIPEMNIQLWNIKMTLAMSGLEANNDVNGLGNYANSTTTTTNTNPVYDSLRGGLQGGSWD